MSAPSSPSIWKVADGFEVERLQQALAENADAWDRHTERTAFYGSPHAGVSDIWVRYRDRADYRGDPSFFAEPHESVWYPVIAQLPAAWSLARKVVRRMGCRTLGGVLITRIRPGHKVDWHTDGGWHAIHYRKFGLQILGNQDQAFRFEDCELRAEPGELYEFINQRPHMVANDSTTDRITMIICAR
jgi:hypothetical protein